MTTFMEKFTRRKNRIYIYKGHPGTVTVKHVFQELRKINEYGKKPGTNVDITTTQSGPIGSQPVIKTLPDDEIAGFVPEDKNMKVLITQQNRSVEMRYNRAYFAVTYDTKDGTAVPSRTLYYGQEIPAIKSTDIPTRIGSKLKGWKPSVDLQGTLNVTETTFRANEIIKDSSGAPLKDLNAKLIMPAQHIKFTAVWDDDPQADYAIQFWTEKADHADDATLLQKYEFVGTHVCRDADTGYRPNLEEETIKGVEFPDLDKARLQKIWNGDTFGGRYPFLYLNKFYKYNKTLTDKENADTDTPSKVKPVSATGKTVYNIYFDRQVYDLYFTKSNSRNDDSTLYPQIWRHGEQLGGPGTLAPYHFKARFNQRMLDWPNDALETKGFAEGKQSYGWGPNFLEPHWIWRDTPPYRLSADEFVDVQELGRTNLYTNEIYAGDGVTIPVNLLANPKTFTTLSFGISQEGGSSRGAPIPHHMDFWMDGFEKNPDWDGRDPEKEYEKIIDYDLYRSKADTGDPNYGHKAPVVQGFTPYQESVRTMLYDQDEFEDLNDERDDITPLPEEKVMDPYGNEVTKGSLNFISYFYNDTDEWGDADGVDEFRENGYIRFYYKRNKYKLRFNNDPATIKADSEYNASNQTDIFYQKPLQDLNLDDVDTLVDMGLTDLLEQDSEGNYQVKRPAGLAPNMVFKGWALDPAGQKMVFNSKETMPAHNLVLYAKWEEPDYKWKVTFDPAGGTLDSIDAKYLATEQKTIQETPGDPTSEVNYPQKTVTPGAAPSDPQVFTVLHRQKLVAPKEPTRDDYFFLGWEVLHYQKDTQGNYTNKFDNSYRKRYIVPELYSFGNDVVDPIYLRAVWVKRNFEKVLVYHHFLDSQYRIDPNNPAKIIPLEERAGHFAVSYASQLSGTWLLAQHEELLKTKDSQLKELYTEYNNRMQYDNTGFQMLKVEPKQIMDNTGNLVDNPNYANNVFHYFYIPFRSRNYKVNYLDDRGQAEWKQATTPAAKQEVIKKYSILASDKVVSKARHYDARNYKPISGWKLTSAPQQQLFYDIDEDTNQLLGINGTGSDEIAFFYQDVRILEVPQDGTTPDGYVRVTFKADEGGSFGSDGAGNPIKELHYDVLKGIKSKQLPIPQQLAGTRDPNKHYVTPDSEKSFDKWDNNPLTDTPLTKNTVFTAQFSGAAPGGNPGTPGGGTPGTPGTPGGGTPTTPTTPGGTPSSPVSPTPTKPSTPTSPATPSTPSQPETPASPSTPSQPSTPASPGTPGTPSAPASPGVPNQPNPRDNSNAFDTTVTGANSLLYLYVAVLFAATGGLILRISRKRAKGSRA